MGTVALRVLDAARAYQGRHEVSPVFSGVRLEVAAGEVFALLGPSGCGKSTLLRAIAGLEPLTTGRVEIAPSADGRRPTGIVYQEPRLLPWLTVAENVALGLRYKANRAARARTAVERALRDVGLVELAGAYPDALSGGQAQRVALARTLITGPSVLLLDEPFAALDPPTRAALQDRLVELAHGRGLAAVLVTHDVDEALRAGDRIGLMTPAPGTLARCWAVTGDDGALRAEILAAYHPVMEAMAV